MKFLFQFRLDKARGKKSVGITAETLQEAITLFDTHYFPGSQKHVCHIYQGNTAKLDRLLFTTNQAGAEEAEAERLKRRSDDNADRIIAKYLNT